MAELVPGADDATAPASDAAPGQEQLKALAKRLKKRIKYFSGQLKTNHVERWKKNRRFVNGDEGDDGEGGLVRVNLAASVVNTIQPNIYAKAPEVSVQPQERITPSDYKGLRQFAKTLEMALNRYAVRDTLLKVRGKESVRSSLTCTTGWAKVTYQKDVREDPLVRNRINDAQDNVQRLEQLLRETQDESQCADYEAKLAETRNLIASLTKQVEVVHANGLVIDNVLPEFIVILDNSVRTIDEYTQASAIAHGVFMTVGAYKTQFKGKAPPRRSTRFGSNDVSGPAEDGEQNVADGGRSQGIDPDDELVLVWEVWSKDDQTVYTLCDGADEFCREPYQPQTLGQQWYPFFPLQLWRVASTLYARALVDNIVELVEEYNTRRTVAAEHRRKNMPVRLLNRASGITNEQIDTINKRGATTDILGVDADPNTPLANQLGHLSEIPYNPAMYDTTDIMRDIEMVSGASDASRSAVSVAKTATEAEIMAMGMQSRTGEQLDTIEDWLTAMMVYCAQLLLLNKSEQEIQEAFGADAVWPELTRKQTFELVSVQIRAGSTSKPNKMRERDQWLQFLPQMQEAVAKIGELRAQGMGDMAEALIKMLDETLRRFDERMSISEFLPGAGKDGEEGEDPGQRMLKQAQAKIAQMVKEAEAALAERSAEISQQEQHLKDEQAQLAISQAQFNADQKVAAGEAKTRAREAKLDARETADDVVRQVTALLDKHQVAAQQAAAAAGQEPNDPGSLVDQVHAVVAPALAVINPPEPQEAVPLA